MTKYEQGAKKERDVGYLFKDTRDKNELNEDAFALETIRSAGSKGIFDIVILTPVGVRFIQVKKIKKNGNWKSEYKEESKKIVNLPKAGDNISFEYWVWENYNGWIHREVIK